MNTFNYQNSKTPVMGGIASRVLTNEDNLGGLLGKLARKFIKPEPIPVGQQEEPSAMKEQVSLDSLLGGAAAEQGQDYDLAAIGSQNSMPFSGFTKSFGDNFLQDQELQTKIGKIKQLTKPEEVKPETGYTTGQKVGGIIGNLGNLFQALDKSQIGTGKQDTSGLDNALAQSMAKVEADKEARYKAGVDSRNAGMSVDKYNLGLEEQQLQNQLNLANQMNNRAMQDRNYGLSVDKANADQRYRDMLLQLKAADSGGEKALTGSQIKEGGKRIDAAKPWYDFSKASIKDIQKELNRKSSNVNIPILTEDQIDKLPMQYKIKYLNLLGNM
jgi:hypothetical protein